MRDMRLGAPIRRHVAGLRRWLPWLPTAVGAVLLVAILAVALPSARRDPDALPEPPPPFLPAPSTPAGSAPAGDPGAATPASPASTPRRKTDRPASPARTRPAASRTPPAAVTGRYRVVDAFPGGFIGEVLVSNAADDARDWTVRLRFPAGVGDLRSSWVESAPQATPGTDGDTFVWSSGVPVGGRSSVALRFQFASSGADRPQSCTVNGSRCRIAAPG